MTGQGGFPRSLATPALVNAGSAIPAGLAAISSRKCRSALNRYCTAICQRPRR